MTRMEENPKIEIRNPKQIQNSKKKNETILLADAAF
jgi:hypothetical protein